MKRNWRLLGYSFILAAATYAQARSEIDAEANRAKVSADVAVELDSFGDLIPVICATAAPGKKLAIFRDCLYAQQAGGALLVTYDEKTKKFEIYRKLQAESITSAAMARLGVARQLQLHSATDMVVVSLLTKSRAFDDKKAMNAAYDHLLESRVTATAPTKYVHKYIPMEMKFFTP